MSTEGGTKAVVAALGANLGIAVSKFVAFAFTGSSSMLSEGVHSVADSGNQVLLLIGGRRSTVAPTKRHQFGFGRRRFLYGFIVSIVLFLVGGVFAIYEGTHKIAHPEHVADTRIAIGVLLIAIVLESLSFRTAIREANKARGDASLLAFIRETRQPELPVILLEDAGALIGLVLALFGVGMATYTGDGRWDGLGAISIGVLLVCIAVFLAVEMASMLVGEAADPAMVADIEAALGRSALATRLIHLRTLHVGPDELLVAAKIAVAPTATAETIASGIDAVEADIRAVVPAAKYIFVEPDIDRVDSRP